MIKKLVSHLGEYKRAAILTPIFSALEAIMDVLLPTIMAFIIDQGIEKGDMNAVVKYGLLTFLVAAIALLLGVLAGRFAATASTGFAGNLRDAMYENIQHFSFSNIDKYSTAGLVTRMTTDVTNLQNAFQMIERMCVRAPVHLVFALIMASMVSRSLTMVFLVAIVFLVAVLAGIMVPTFGIFDKVFKNYDNLNASVQENVSAIRVVKSFVREVSVGDIPHRQPYRLLKRRVGYRNAVVGLVAVPHSRMSICYLRLMRMICPNFWIKTALLLS